ncbi:MAG: ABC transporter permease [Anaerolineaceae bacterium]|nr:ABC transporter permease [Anaerolineaceae bacterium]
MKVFLSALWAETLKARRSKVPLFTAAGFTLLPLVSGLFMIILKDPERAKELGIISVKAQLVGGTADWPSLFGMLKMGTGIAGLILFAIITAWVFGREFSDHTAKELLALPTPRGIIVGAKFGLILFWIMGLSLFIFVITLGIGAAVDIPGWSSALVWTSFWSLLLITFLTVMLMPVVALIASIGRGYLPPLGWSFLTMALAQIAAVMGWGEWFPWSVPGLLSEFSGPQSEPLGMHSYLMVLLVFIIGVAATFMWWQKADQTR